MRFPGLTLLLALACSPAFAQPYSGPIIDVQKRGQVHLFLSLSRASGRTSNLCLIRKNVPDPISSKLGPPAGSDF